MVRDEILLIDEDIVRRIHTCMICISICTHLVVVLEGCSGILQRLSEGVTVKAGNSGGGCREKYYSKSGRQVFKFQKSSHNLSILPMIEPMK